MIPPRKPMHRNPCLRANRKSTSAERVGAAVGVFWGEFGQPAQRLRLLFEQCGATRNACRGPLLLKDMVGPCGLATQTSNVSILSAVWEQMRLSEYKLYCFNALSGIQGNRCCRQLHRICAT